MYLLFDKFFFKSSIYFLFKNSSTDLFRIVQMLLVFICIYTVAEERQLTIPWVAFLWHLFTDFSKMLKIFSWKCFRHNANMYFVARTYSAYVLFGFGSSPETLRISICRKIEKCNSTIVTKIIRKLEMNFKPNLIFVIFTCKSMKNFTKLHFLWHLDSALCIWNRLLRCYTVICSTTHL